MEPNDRKEIVEDMVKALQAEVFGYPRSAQLFWSCSVGSIKRKLDGYEELKGKKVAILCDLRSLFFEAFQEWKARGPSEVEIRARRVEDVLGRLKRK